MNHTVTTDKKASMALAESLVETDRHFSVLPTASNPNEEGNVAFTPKIPILYNFGFDAASSAEEVRDIWNGTNESGENEPHTGEDGKTKKKWYGLNPAGKSWKDKSTGKYLPLKGVYGVGICCKLSQIVVLDVDTAEHGKDGKGADGLQTWAALCAEHNYTPNTFTVRTGSGGLHIYFRQPTGIIIPNSTGKVGAGLDIKSGSDPKGHGGQVIAPGNVFEAPDGTIRKYEIIDDSPIQDMPEWLITLAGGRDARKTASQDAPKAASSAGTRICLEDIPQTDQGRLEKWSREAITAELAKLRTAPKGERNDTLNNVALRSIRIAMNGSIKGQGNWLKQDVLQVAQEAGLSMSEAEKTFNSARKKAEEEGPVYPKDYSPAQTATSGQAIASTPAPAAGAPAQPEEWPAIVEYGTTGDKLRIAPLMQYMPAVIRDFCEGLAREVQVPLEMCLAMMLPAISTCVQGKFKVHVFGNYHEPVNVYTLCAMPPSNGKSPVVGRCTKPLRDWEQKKREEMKLEVELAQHQFDMAQNRIGELKAKSRKLSFSKSEDKRELKKNIEEINEITQNMPEVPTVPRLLVDDITPEKMASVMAEQHGKIGMISAEGGIFDILAGMYSESGACNIQIVLKSWTGGEAYTVDRISREAVILDNPLLSMGINVQPGIIQKRKAAERFRMSGLDARFLYFIPDSLLGSRVPETEAMPAAADNAYKKLIRCLLDVPYSEDGEPHVLELSTEAKALRNEFFSIIEAEMKPGGQFDEMTDWAGKIPGGAVRLAGLLHLAETRGDLTQSVISGETMQTAVSLAQFLCQHAKLAYELLGGDEQSLDAQKILKWIQTNKLETFTASECQQKFKDTSGLKDKKIREAALQDLIDRYYIREISQQPTGKTGRKPGIKYQVNPAFFDGKTEGE